MAGHVALVSTAVLGGTGRQNAKRNLVSGQRKWEDELREQGENLRKGSWNRESPEGCVCVCLCVCPHTSLGFTVQLCMCGPDLEQQSTGFESCNKMKPLSRAHSTRAGLMREVEPKMQSRRTELRLELLPTHSRQNMQSEPIGRLPAGNTQVS